MQVKVQNGARFYTVLAFLFALSTLGFWLAKRSVDVGWWPLAAGNLTWLSLVRALSLTKVPTERRMVAVVSACIALLFLGGGAFVLLNPTDVRLAVKPPPVLVIEDVRTSDIPIVLDAIDHRIVTDGACELLVVNDQLTGKTTVSLWKRSPQCGSEGRQ